MLTFSYALYHVFCDVFHMNYVYFSSKICIFQETVLFYNTEIGVNVSCCITGILLSIFTALIMSDTSFLVI